MKGKKIVYYKELSGSFKQKVLVKYLLNKGKPLLNLELENKIVNAIEIWYKNIDYLVCIEKSELPNFERDSLLEKQNQEELDSFYRLGYSDDFMQESSD